MSLSVDWHSRWAEGRIGFHNDNVHPDLIRNSRRLLGEGAKRVLVPLCGKTVDMRWLADQGHEVVGVELVEKAVGSFFAEQALEPSVERVGELVVYRSGRITVFAGDLFSVGPERAGPVDAIWDRAALVAIPPENRQRYADHLRRLGGAAWSMLLSSFTYDITKMEGPPWSVPESEVRGYYGGLKLEKISERDEIEQVSFKDAGHDYWLVSTYLMRG